VNLTLTVHNPNPQGISLAEADYKLSVAGKQQVAGKPAAGLRIAGGGSSDVVLPAQIADMSFTQAALEVPLTLSNSNPFPLPLGSLVGDLRQALAAARALREGRARVALDRTLSSGGASVPVHVEREVDFTR
jgi:Late embryogenesis abundant protein